VKNKGRYNHRPPAIERKKLGDAFKERLLEAICDMEKAAFEANAVIGLFWAIREWLVFGLRSHLGELEQKQAAPRVFMRAPRTADDDGLSVSRGI
jgi:hypothetical protein